jgi:hypothetical protein
MKNKKLQARRRCNVRVLGLPGGAAQKWARSMTSLHPVTPLWCSPTTTQPTQNRPTAGGGEVKCDPIVLGRAGPVLGPCWAVLCRAEPLDGPSSTAGARPAPDQPLRLKGLLLLGSWGLHRGRAPSGAPGLAVQLGRGPHGQCPGSA